MIDQSGSMAWWARHKVCNTRSSSGYWYNCSYIQPRIQGKSLFEAARSKLRDQVANLPTKDEVDKLNQQFGSKYEYIKLQIVAYSTYNSPLYNSGPQILTHSSKSQALRWIDRLRPGGWTNPWNGLCEALKDDNNVGQVILLSDGIPMARSGFLSHGRCLGQYGEYSKIIDKYNRDVRSKKPSGELIIDSISLFHNFCDSTKNWRNRNWLGVISSGDQSQCTHVK